MKRFYLLLICFQLQILSLAQGYLGKHVYVALDILHPWLGSTDLRLNAGVLVKRFYALDFQFNYLQKKLDLYSRYNFNYTQYSSREHEYLMGTATLSCTGKRITFRNFNKGSHKAAPIGWYMNTTFDQTIAHIEGDIVLKSSKGFDISSNEFIENSENRRFDSKIIFNSLLISPGKSYLIAKSCFIDLSLEMGFRKYSTSGSELVNGERIYFYDPIFKNNMNKNYRYLHQQRIVASHKIEFIYEPVIKIGYLF